MSDTGWAAKLREPFKPEQVGKLPRLTCKDCSDRKCQQHRKEKCRQCGAYISTAHIHLDYVGHAATTDRLLQVDPAWTWEPVAVDDRGFPAFDGNGGLWIRLTVCGVTRLGYGDAAGKKGGDAIKEAVGDAIRNGAMRFGVALDLWSKEDLDGSSHDDQTVDEPAVEKPAPKPKPGPAVSAPPAEIPLGATAPHQRVHAESSKGANWHRAVAGLVPDETERRALIWLASAGRTTSAGEAKPAERTKAHDWARAVAAGAAIDISDAGGVRMVALIDPFGNDIERHEQPVEGTP